MRRTTFFSNISSFNHPIKCNQSLYLLFNKFITIANQAILLGFSYLCIIITTKSVNCVLILRSYKKNLDDEAYPKELGFNFQVSDPYDLGSHAKSFHNLIRIVLRIALSKQLVSGFVSEKNNFKTTTVEPQGCSTF